MYPRSCACQDYSGLPVGPTKPPGNGKPGASASRNRKNSAIGPMRALATGPLLGLMFLAAWPASAAEPRVVHVLIHFETTGHAELQAWSHSEDLPLNTLLPELVRCQGKVKIENNRFGDLDCSNALQRDGLALKTTIDLSPIAQKLAPQDQIELQLIYPRLGFDSLSTPMPDEGTSMRASRTAQFAAASAPQIRLRFGYRRNQLALLYCPCLALAFALTLLAAILSRTGLANLNLSVFLLGTIFWMGLTAMSGAGDPIRILLYGSPLGEIAALLFAFFPPLLCVAAGSAIGREKRLDRKRGDIFAEIFWAYGVFLLPMTCAIGALPAMVAGDWLVAIPWLIVLPLAVLSYRLGRRARTGSSVRLLNDGELKERVTQLATLIGRPKMRAYIAFTPRSQHANAFTLPGRSIFFTAPLIRTLNKREVDAVIAHELNHFRNAGNRPWAALAFAMVLFETSVSQQLLQSAGGLLFALLFPVILYLAALRGVRKREFQADAGAIAMIGDPRPLIGALARIARHNQRPLDLNPIVESFSTHPSTLKRIRTMASAGRLADADVDMLLTADVPGERYDLPFEHGSVIFSLAWQKANAGIYGWAVLFFASGSSLLVAWLVYQFAGAGINPFLAGTVGIILGCALTKGLGAAVLSSNYSRLRRRLAARLGVNGQLIGLAVDSEPRAYSGFRFSDAGLLWFENGRLCYRSERTTIALNPEDVIEVAMVNASPSSWIRLQPMLRFRQSGSGKSQAIILHPVEWLPTQRRLLRSIEQWRTTPTPAEPTSIEGLQAVPGQPFQTPTIAGVARTFLIPGGLTLVAAIPACWARHADWWYVLYALIVTASAHIFMFLATMLYRPPANLDTSATPARIKEGA